MYIIAYYALFIVRICANLTVIGDSPFVVNYLQFRLVRALSAVSLLYIRFAFIALASVNH